MLEQKEIERLEKRIDDGLAAIRKEQRADFRLLVGWLAALMLGVVVVGFAAVIALGS